MPGLYWRKNQIKSTLVDFSVSGNGARAAEAANDNSDLTHGADAEAICGNPVRGLRARRAEAGDAGPAADEDAGGASASAAAAGAMDELDIIEELRQWKMQTAEKVEQMSLSDEDEEGDEGVEHIFSDAGDAGARRPEEGIVNVLRIPRDDLVSDVEILQPPAGAGGFPPPFPLADIDGNGSRHHPAGMELPVGRLRPKFSKQNGFLPAKAISGAW